MTGATHMLAAATIYTLTKSNESVALILSFTSHFALDAIPHYEIKRTWNFILGAIVGVFLLITACVTKAPLLFVAVFIGALPDLNWLFDISKNLNKLHNLFHFKNEATSPRYLFIIEMLVAIIIVVFVSKYLISTT